MLSIWLVWTDSYIHYCTLPLNRIVNCSAFEATAGLHLVSRFDSRRDTGQMMADVDAVSFSIFPYGNMAHLPGIFCHYEWHGSKATWDLHQDLKQIKHHWLKSIASYDAGIACIIRFIVLILMKIIMDDDFGCAAYRNGESISNSRFGSENFEVWAGARGEIRMRCPPLVKSRQSIPSRFNLKYHEPFHHPAVHHQSRTDLVAWK